MTELSEEEALRYDRQVRIWGMICSAWLLWFTQLFINVFWCSGAEAQLRLQTSKVLVCGLAGIHLEVIKNIVLMGVSVVLQDDSLVTWDDLANNFFVSTEDVGRNTAEAVLPRVKELNHYANVSIITNSLSSLPKDYFKEFSVILLLEDDEVWFTDVFVIDWVTQLLY